MRKKGIFTLIILLLILILSDSWKATKAQDESTSSLNHSDSAKKLIVIVGTENDAKGAGIIVGTRADYLFIVTAHHVVEDLIDINVEFEFWRGVPMQAERIYSDENLDLAVLSVNLPENRPHDFIASIPFDLLSDTFSLRERDDIYLIGHPAGEYYDINSAKVRRVTPEEIRFDPVCSGGHSGGGLFNEQWELAGMITRDITVHCKAIKFERICETLRYEGYPIGIPPTPTPTPTPTPPDGPPIKEIIIGAGAAVGAGSILYFLTRDGDVNGDSCEGPFSGKFIQQSLAPEWRYTRTLNLCQKDNTVTGTYQVEFELFGCCSGTIDNIGVTGDVQIDSGILSWGQVHGECKCSWDNFGIDEVNGIHDATAINDGETLRVYYPAPEDNFTLEFRRQ